jgi:hypothetical protein
MHGLRVGGPPSPTAWSARACACHRMSCVCACACQPCQPPHLVQDEKVGPLHQHAGHVQPPPLAARQGGHLAQCNKQTQAWCSTTSGHRHGAVQQVDTGMVQYNKWTQAWCSTTRGHRHGAVHADTGTGRGRGRGAARAARVPLVPAGRPLAHLLELARPREAQLRGGRRGEGGDGCGLTACWRGVAAVCVWHARVCVTFSSRISGGSMGATSAPEATSLDLRVSLISACQRHTYTFTYTACQLHGTAHGSGSDSRAAPSYLRLRFPLSPLYPFPFQFPLFPRAPSLRCHRS